MNLIINGTPARCIRQRCDHSDPGHLDSPDIQDRIPRYRFKENAHGILSHGSRIPVHTDHRHQVLIQIHQNPEAQEGEES